VAFRGEEFSVRFLLRYKEIKVEYVIYIVCLIYYYVEHPLVPPFQSYSSFVLLSSVYQTVLYIVLSLVFLLLVQTCLVSLTNIGAFI
jgi:hypothetical protein